jgi:cytochrome b
MSLRSLNQGLILPMRVWDAPTRLFHIAAIVLIVVSYISIRLAGIRDPHASALWMRVHLDSGYAMLTLLVFRLAWGLVGSETSRFRSFAVSPMAVLRSLRQPMTGEPDTDLGHRAAGGWIVLIMLLLLGVQIGSGLCASANGGEGPLAGYFGKGASESFSVIHGWIFILLLAAILLHVAAAIAFAVVKKQDLVRLMVTGKKRLPAAMRAPRMASPLMALAILVLAGAAVWVLAAHV